MLIIIYTNDFLAQDITKFYTKVKTSVQEISGVCDTVLDLANTKHVPIIDESTATMTRIDQIEGQQAARNREGCYRLVVEEACAYNKGFSNLASSAKNPTTTTTIERELERQPPNFQPLAEYFSDLEQSLETVKQCYFKFNKSCDDAIVAADRAASANKLKAARPRQRETAMPRDAVVAAGVGVGVTASIIAGLFTFGYGTIIGMGLTAAATTGVVGGATAGAAGYSYVVGAGPKLSANDYQQLAAAFDQLKATYISLQKATSDMQGQLCHFHQFLEIIREVLAQYT